MKSRRKLAKREYVPRITSDDQITDGKFKGKHLTLSPSPKMAPTSWQLREILFRTLHRKIRAKRFLDLCSGTGAVGLGAISRAALLVTFVERKARNCSLIRENMKSLEISEGHAEVVEEEVVPFLKRMAKRRRYWDVVYFAPPYDFQYDHALDCFERGWAVKSGGILVIEHHSEMFFPEHLGVLKRREVVSEDESALSIYDRID